MLNVLIFGFRVMYRHIYIYAYNLLVILKKTKLENIFLIYFGSLINFNYSDCNLRKGFCRFAKFV